MLIIFHRRSTDYITFTSNQVHLLPGFPASSPHDAMNAVVAFYVKFPPGVAIGVNDTLDGDLLVDILNGSLTRIGTAINKTLLSVSLYAADNTTVVPPTPRQTKSSGGVGAVIGGSVAAVLIVIIIVVIVVFFIRYDIFLLLLENTTGFQGLVNLHIH